MEVLRTILTIEMEKMIIGTRGIFLLIDYSLNIRMNVGILNTQTQSTRWTACVLLQPRLQT